MATKIRKARFVVENGSKMIVFRLQEAIKKKDSEGNDLLVTMPKKFYSHVDGALTKLDDTLADKLFDAIYDGVSDVSDIFVGLLYDEKDNLPVFVKADK